MAAWLEARLDSGGLSSFHCNSASCSSLNCHQSAYSQTPSVSARYTTAEKAPRLSPLFLLPSEIKKKSAYGIAPNPLLIGWLYNLSMGRKPLKGSRSVLSNAAGPFWKAGWQPLSLRRIMPRDSDQRTDVMLHIITHPYPDTLFVPGRPDTR